MAYLNSPFECGVCGKKLAANTRACPACGADENTGLREDTWGTDAASELGFIDEEGFDYEAFLKEEFDKDGKVKKKRDLHPVWWIAGIALLISMLYAVFSGFWR
ncbi:MAG: hypothetical protein KDN22_14225 [Verrucomicrobiae bacterium]|nr:hypothetical protein [Verrucomicrobiae bacterium]